LYPFLCDKLSNKSIEKFTQYFIQVYPTTGIAPLTVSFVPFHKDEYIPSTVDFGDSTIPYNSETTNVFEHTYDKIGVYCGNIVYDIYDGVLGMKKQIKQDFKINVLGFEPSDDYSISPLYEGISMKY